MRRIVIPSQENHQPYDPEKFKNFHELLKSASDAEAVLVHHPEVLSDNYTELVTNLNNLAKAGLSLKTLPPSEKSGKRQHDNLMQ